MSIKGSDPRENVVCSTREHRGERRRETARKREDSASPLGREGTGGVER